LAWPRAEDGPDLGPDLGAAVPRLDVRLVNYLGSKLRVLEPITEAVSEVLPKGLSVCDLFAGSGVVSRALAANWSVTAVDIQEYSRVLCAALLDPPREPDALEGRLKLAASNGSTRTRLREALADLIDDERQSLESAARGEMGALCELVELGSLWSARPPQATGATRIRSLLGAALDRLRLQGLDKSPDTVVTRYFGGVYFSWEQAIDLDALLTEAHKMDSGARDYFLAAILAVASDAVDTVGKQFAQPIRPRDSTGKPKQHLVRQMERDRSISVFDRFALWLERLKLVPRGSTGRAIRCDFREALNDHSLHFDAVYADPPYTRDHYSRFYHALETMARHDEPRISTTMIRSGGSPQASRGIYRDDRHQSPFCIKSQAPGAFDELFGGVRARAIPLVLSYSPFNSAAGNRPRLLTVDDLTHIARRHFSDVDVRDVGGLTHNKLNVANRNVEVDYVAEVILVCRP